MILVALAWIYVVLMIAVVEATSPQGTALGAIVTFVLYGVLPLSVVLYVLASPARRRRRLAAEASDDPALEPDRGAHPAGDAVAPEREEP